MTSFIENTVKLKIARIAKNLFEKFKYPYKYIMKDQLKFGFETKLIIQIDNNTKETTEMCVIRCDVKNDYLEVGYWDIIQKADLKNLQKYIQSFADIIENRSICKIKLENATCFMSQLNMEDFKLWEESSRFGL